MLQSEMQKDKLEPLDKKIRGLFRKVFLLTSFWISTTKLRFWSGTQGPNVGDYTRQVFLYVVSVEGVLYGVGVEGASNRVWVDGVTRNGKKVYSGIKC